MRPVVSAGVFRRDWLCRGKSQVAFCFTAQVGVRMPAAGVFAKRLRFMIPLSDWTVREQARPAPNRLPRRRQAALRTPSFDPTCSPAPCSRSSSGLPHVRQRIKNDLCFRPGSPWGGAASRPYRPAHASACISPPMRNFVLIKSGSLLNVPLAALRLFPGRRGEA